ncbi:hypothetical protein [Phytomonospora endophytica]|uniref:Tetratricopeptide (TPR) repeat protein n=1 Tax=Phytomonospora endophytica TaxID=714109 RepID=A0A841FT10_9ACTN|nr:hypothetical protein [Phytomonospora endophytica]MBB6038944.1 tetratricopeptide (TPR) repeat protein [Phytomonospora endophytica]
MPDDLRHAGELLYDIRTAAATGSLASKSGEVESLAAFYARTPDDATAAVGLTLLAMARLSAHVEHDLGEPFQAASSRYETLPAPDDEHARALAAEVVAHATHARGLDPNDNLSAFEQGLAHELRGERAQAADAYRTAVRLDPYDHPAVARLETLTGEEAERPDEDPPCTHAGAFYVLELVATAPEGGDQERVVLVSTDAAAVRAEADALFATGRHTYETLDYAIETHQPGEDSESDFLLMALDDAADGHPTLTWDDIDMPPLREPLLPPGRAVRENGEVLFFGRHVGEVAEKEEFDDMDDAFED